MKKVKYILKQLTILEDLHNRGYLAEAKVFAKIVSLINKKLIPEQEKEILRLFKEGVSIQALSKKFDASESTIRKLVK